MFQLDLFETSADVSPAIPQLTRPHPIVDESVSQEIADALIKSITVKKRGVVVQRIIHPDTFSQAFPDVGDRTKWTDPSLKDIRVNKKRIRMMVPGKTCSCCGRPVNMYTTESLESTPGVYLNAYTVTPRGAHEMTVDHIVPQCIGGNDTDINRDVNCRLCNEKKSNVMRLEEIERVSANLQSYLKPWANKEYVCTVLNLMCELHHYRNNGNKQARQAIEKCLNHNMAGVSQTTPPASYAKRIKSMKAALTRYQSTPHSPQSGTATPSSPTQLLWFERLSMWISPIANALVFPR